MSSPNTFMAHLLAHRAAQARALLRRAVRVNTRSSWTRARTRVFFGVLALVALVVIPAGIAMADPGDGAANTWVSPFRTKDSHGIPMSSYQLSVDEGGVSNPKNQIASFFLIAGWDLYRIYVGIALFLFDYAMQFQLLDLMRAPAAAIAQALQDTIGGIGVIPAVTVVAFGISVIWIQTGKSASGFAGLGIALLMGSLLTTAAVRPMDTIAGEDGLIIGARDLGVGLSSQIVTGGEDDSTDAKDLQANSSAKLVDVFVRKPHQLVNYGASVDSDAKCVKVYDEDLKKGYPVNGADDDRPRKNMGKCNKSYVNTADNPINGLIGLVFLYPSGGLLVFFFFVLALVLGVLTAIAMFEAARAAWVMLQAIIPGDGTREIWSSVCIVGVVLGYIVATLMGIGAFLLLLEALMTAEGIDPRLVFILIDCFILVSAILLLNLIFKARSKGKKLGEKIHQKSMPAAKAVDTSKASPMRAVTTAATMASPAVSMMTSRRLGSAAGASPAGASPAGAGPAGANSTAPTTPTKSGSTMGKLTKGGAKLTWGATKLGLASTVGAPVYAPRAVGAVKDGMSAKRTRMSQTFTQARQRAGQRIDDKRTQATDFGREYAHNLGVAGRTIGKYSGATKAAGAAMSLGADPMTSGLAGAAVHLAGNARRPQPTTAQHARPTPTRAPLQPPTIPTPTRPQPTASTTQPRPTTPAPTTPASTPTNLPTVSAPEISKERASQNAARDQLLARMAARHAERRTAEENAVPVRTVADVSR